MGPERRDGPVRPSPDLDARFRRGLERAFAGERPGRLGLAVSGGGDSVALLTLAVEGLREIDLCVATVDHGLRPEAAHEAGFVAELAHAHGLSHRTLTLPPSLAPQGNLAAWARRARLDALRAWAAEEGVRHIALGHTLDDQAETLLLRLLRGSGVDGLSAMAPRREDGAVVWLRPLLGVRRGELRALLRERGTHWCEDPTNEDLRFERARVRRAMQALRLDPARLAETALRMREAREVLERRALEIARSSVRVEAGDVVLDQAVLGEPAETRERLVAAALSFVSGNPYRPRHDALTRMIGSLQAGRESTLHGCLAYRHAGEVRIGRELQAVREAVALPGELWDGRWRIEAPAAAGSGLEVRALGEAGLALCPGWRDSGLPRATLLASPAVWRRHPPGTGPVADPLEPPIEPPPVAMDRTQLVSAPLAGLAGGWTARLAEDRARFTDLLMSR